MHVALYHTQCTMKNVILSLPYALHKKGSQGSYCNLKQEKVFSFILVQEALVGL